ncbi:MAG: hypothetical protein E6R08_03465 [Nevskiaceae bacterium]|jgi:hypothetical protein|nr:MAG: hypothetical protein E6R08_03465 [Nevskiaceae bacterium]
MNDQSSAWLADPELTSLRGLVFKAVGKSIYLYQEIEKRIKFLNAAISIELSGSQDEWPEQLAKHQSAFDKKTMRPLMTSLLERLYFSPEADKGLDTNYSSKWKLRFSLQSTAEYIRERGKTLEAFVDDRNHVVHHYFEKVNFADASQLEAMIKELEAQHQVIDDEIKGLNQIIQLLKESAQAHSDWWESEEGKKQWEVIRLQNSFPINFLERFSLTNTKEHGWAVFPTACSELRNHYVTEIDRFFKTFPFKTLQLAATASGLFEFVEEKTAKGERLLYRAKATDYEYTTSHSS